MDEQTPKSIQDWIGSTPSTEDPIIRATAILAWEFGWTPDYVMFHLPISYVSSYMTLIQDRKEMERVAVEGKGYVPSYEKTPARVDSKIDLIRKNYSKIDEEQRLKHGADSQDSKGQKSRYVPR